MRNASLPPPGELPRVNFAAKKNGCRSRARHVGAAHYAACEEFSNEHEFWAGLSWQPSTAGGSPALAMNVAPSRCVVISQPMFFPWVGMLEQMRLADVYVHYDDVQFSKGSFTNRVQIKTGQGVQWLSVPLKDLSLGTLIQDVLIDDRKDWRRTHRTTLAQAYAKAPHRAEMLALVDEVYADSTRTICELSVASMKAVHHYFGFLKPSEFCFSSALNIPGSGSQRVLDVVKAVGGNIYLTGHGARHYLDHDLFERAGVKVEYIDYQKRRYPQLHGEFTPFVSVLDLIANCGKAGVEVFVSSGVGWREFLARE